MVVFPSIEFEGAENRQGTRTTLDWNDLDMAMAKALRKKIFSPCFLWRIVDVRTVHLARLVLYLVPHDSRWLL
jgi:hypothetical protein